MQYDFSNNAGNWILKIYKQICSTLKIFYLLLVIC